MIDKIKKQLNTLRAFLFYKYVNSNILKRDVKSDSVVIYDKSIFEGEYIPHSEALSKLGSEGYFKVLKEIHNSISSYDSKTKKTLRASIASSGIPTSIFSANINLYSKYVMGGYYPTLIQRFPKSQIQFTTSWFQQIFMLATMYSFSTAFGSSIISKVVDSRTNKIVGDGINVNTKDQKVLEWAKLYLKENKLKTLFNTMVSLGELESRVGVCLIKDLNYKCGVRLKAVSCVQNMAFLDVINETIFIKDSKVDVERISAVSGDKWDEQFNNSLSSLPNISSEGEFDKDTCVVIDVYNTGVAGNTPASRCVFVAQAYDLAIDGLRSVNDTYGQGDLYLVSAGESDSKKLALWAKSVIETKQKLNTSVTGQSTINNFYANRQSGVYSIPSTPVMLGPPKDSYESLKLEMELSIQTVSLIADLSPQELGYPSLFGTKAGGEDVTSSHESNYPNIKNRWVEGLYRVFDKSAKLAGIVLPDDFTITLPEPQTKLFKHFVSTWLQFYKDGVISRRTLLEKLPDIDPEEELERLELEKTAGAIETTV